MEQETVAKGERHRENTEFVLLKSSAAKGCPQTPSYQYQIILRVFISLHWTQIPIPANIPRTNVIIKKQKNEPALIDDHGMMYRYLNYESTHQPKKCLELRNWSTICSNSAILISPDILGKSLEPKKPTTISLTSVLKINRKPIGENGATK